MAHKKQSVRAALGIISFLAFPVTIFFFSPVLSVYGASQGWLVGSLFVFIMLFVQSLFFGRAYCGWVCPTGSFQEWCFGVNNNKIPHWLSFLKYVWWVPWMLLIGFFFVKAGGLKKFDFLFGTAHGISVSEPMMYIIYYGVLIIFVLMAFLIGRRAACHGLCWMAPFMVIGTAIRNKLRLPGLFLATNYRACVHCGKCTRACTMSLPTEQMVENSYLKNHECISCGVCASVCPKVVITYKVGRPPRIEN